MVLSPGLTPAGALMIPRRLEGMSEDQKQSLRQLEISPRTLAIWERIAVRIEQHGGAAIAVDYGEEGPLGDTLLAIKDHKFCDVLTDPGSADISAYVDFGAMRRVIENREPSPGALYGGVECFGPVSQQALLVSLGIGPRLEALVNGCQTQEEADRLIAGCTRLVSGDDAPGEGPGRGYDADGSGGEVEEGGDAPPPPPPPGMGIRYKAIAMVSKGMGAPVGFQQ
jgi:NADH dehydrogenase [ubiquinone] 1 alpha subcomplex assembly factor 7